MRVVHFDFALFVAGTVSGDGRYTRSVRTLDLSCAEPWFEVGGDGMSPIEERRSGKSRRSSGS